MRDESHARMMESFLKAKPALAMIHFWGADYVSHAFWREAFGDASPDERRDFGSAIAAYYEYLDELVGRLRRAAGPGTLVIALSDHGFEAEKIRDGEPRPRLSGRHRPEAVLIIAGEGARRGASLDGARALDIAPTILRYLDAAPPAGEEGRPLNEAFEPGVLPPPRDARVPARRNAPSAPSGLSADELSRLRALGYIR